MTHAFCLVSFLVIASRTTLHNPMASTLNTFLSTVSTNLPFFSILPFFLGDGWRGGVNYTSQCLLTAKQIRTHYSFSTEIVT